MARVILTYPQIRTSLALGTQLGPAQPMMITQNCRPVSGQLHQALADLSARSTEEAPKPAWVGKEPCPEERTLRGVVKVQVVGAGVPVEETPCA